MKQSFIAGICFVFLFSCSHTKKNPSGPDTASNTGTSTTSTTISNIPSCLQQTINKINGKESDSPPLQIDEYIYKGKKVYLHTADCCDQYNVVFDENCKGICSPSGGIDGRGDRKCNDFKDSAKLVRTIWKK